MFGISELSITYDGSTLLLLLLLALGCFSIYFMYRETVPPLKKSRKIFLAGVRVFSVITLVLLFFKPVINYTLTSEISPEVSILIDNSSSMKYGNNGKDKTETLNQFLTSDSFNNMQRDFELNYFTLGSSIKQIDNYMPDSILYNEEITDISSALLRISETADNKSLKGVILLSDGIYNIGNDPIREAAKSPVPIFPLRIGEPSSKNDIVITDVNYNEIAYAGIKIPVHLTIRNTGYSDQSAMILLKKGGNVLESQNIRLPESTRESSYTVEFMPENAGLHKIELEVTPLENEESTINNYAEIYVKALNSKVNILILTGRPNNDYRFLKSSLENNEDFEVTAAIRKTTGFYNSSDNSVIEKIDEFDLVIMIDYPVEDVDNLAMQIKNTILNNKIPLLYIRGETQHNRVISYFSDLLGINSIFRAGSLEQIYAGFAGNASEHPLFRIYPDPERVAATWNKLPPVFTGPGSITPNDNSATLVVVDPVKSNRSQYIGGRPMIFSSFLNGRKVLCFNIYGLWKWKMLELRDPEIEGVYDKVFSNAVKWLTNNEDSKQVRISTNKEIYDTGEKIRITAQVYDENFEPVDNADVNATVKNNGITLNRALLGRGEGIYYAEIELMEPGEYTFSGNAVKHGINFGEDSGSFVINNFSIEALNTGIDTLTLSGIANLSGGRVINNSDDLVGLFSSEPVYEELPGKIYPWDKGVLLIVIIILINTEIFFRKRWGLL